MSLSAFALNDDFDIHYFVDKLIFFLIYSFRVKSIEMSSPLDVWN